MNTLHLARIAAAIALTTGLGADEVDRQLVDRHQLHVHVRHRPSMSAGAALAAAERPITSPGP